ncbi:MAG: LysR family transcriptional regulator [Alphaproteobacteria bacterium]|nr:LysR family transcriptional regulator [Alphaproteobacteria bacterium]
MTIEPGPLRTVIAAAEHGSFRRAAAALNLRQSTLSRRIRQLEEQLGVELFERFSGGVRVTPAGVDVVRAARRLFEQMDRMVSTARSAGRGESGDITVGFCTSLSASKLRAVLAGYIEAFRHIEINVVERSRAGLFDGLRMGDLDIVIVVGEARDHGGPSMLLWSERIIVALPAGHRLTSNDMIYWTDLKGEFFLLSRRDPGPDMRNIIVQKLSAPGEAPDIASWDVSSESILAMLKTGHRISVHCESCAGLAYSGVVYREVRDASGPSYVSFTACWDDANKNPALARFLDLLREHHNPTLIT